MAAKRVAGKYSLAVVMCFESDSPARQNGGRGKHLKIKHIPTPTLSSIGNGGGREKSNGATASLADICMADDFRFAPVAQKV